jgi:hypothetical protein
LRSSRDEGEKTMSHQFAILSQIKAFFTTTQKTSWGKNEIVKKIDEIEIEYLRGAVSENTPTISTAEQQPE